MLCVSGIIWRKATSSLRGSTIYGIVAFPYGGAIGDNKQVSLAIMLVCESPLCLFRLVHCIFVYMSVTLERDRG